MSAALNYSAREIRTYGGDNARSGEAEEGMAGGYRGIMAMRDLWRYLPQWMVPRHTRTRVLQHDRPRPVQGDPYMAIAAQYFFVAMYTAALFVIHLQIQILEIGDVI